MQAALSYECFECSAYCLEASLILVSVWSFPPFLFMLTSINSDSVGIASVLINRKLMLCIMLNNHLVCNEIQACKKEWSGH